MAKVVTGLVRFSFQHVFSPQAPQGGGEPKYSVTCLLPKTDTQTMELIKAAKAQATQEGIQSKWGGTAPPAVAFPIHDGDGVRPNGEKFGPECAGCWVFTASSKQAPGVVDAQTQPIIDPNEFYSGCYGRISFNIYPYFAAGKKGLGFGLNNVQKLKDGEPLGAVRPTAEEDFGTPVAVPQQTAIPATPQIGPITGQPVDPGVPF